MVASAAGWKEMMEALHGVLGPWVDAPKEQSAHKELLSRYIEAAGRMGPDYPNRRDFLKLVPARAIIKADGRTRARIFEDALEANIEGLRAVTYPSDWSDARFLGVLCERIGRLWLPLDSDRIAGLIDAAVALPYDRRLLLLDDSLALAIGFAWSNAPSDALARSARRASRALAASMHGADQARAEAYSNAVKP